MANRSFLVFPESDDPEDCLLASDEHSCKYSVPLFWLALFSAADLKTHEVPGAEDVGLLVAPLAQAAPRLRARRDALVARFGPELAGDLDEFIAGLEKCPFKLVALNFQEIQAMDDEPPAYLARLRGSLQALDDRRPDALDRLYAFQGDYFGYASEHDRVFAFPWLKSKA